jgi:hypothetical protein
MKVQSNSEVKIPLVDQVKNPDELDKRERDTEEQDFNKTTLKLEEPHAVQWWWWWDIAAAVLCLTSMFMVIFVLVAMNNKPLDDWPLAIQPNSMIAVLTTIGKAAMLVPIASAISQLKWLHYRHEARPLNHLQIYDDASRGPWGSLIYLKSLPKPTLASCGALIMILALGIEPSAQQILSFKLQKAELKNTTAQIGVAENYVSKIMYYGLYSRQGYGKKADLVQTDSMPFCQPTIPQRTRFFGRP